MISMLHSWRGGDNCDVQFEVRPVKKSESRVVAGLQTGSSELVIAEVRGFDYYDTCTATCHPDRSGRLFLPLNF